MIDRPINIFVFLEIYHDLETDTSEKISSPSNTLVFIRLVDKFLLVVAFT